MSQRRVGLVGAGRIAEFHIGAVRGAGAEVAGIVASSPGSSQAAAEAWGIERAYESVDDLLHDPSITTVHVLTPNALHAAVVAAALESGKHVVCEKPMGLSARQTHDLLQVARRVGRCATVCLTYRYHHVVEAARRMVARGVLGEVVSFHASYQQSWRMSESGGWKDQPGLGGPSRVIADIGVHVLDLVEFISGHELESFAVASRGANGDRGLDDIASLAVVTRRGAVGTVQLSQVALGHVNSIRLEIAGSRGTIVLSHDGRPTLQFARSANFEPVPFAQSSGIWEDTAGAFSRLVAASYAHFDGADIDVPDLEVAHRSAQLVDAALVAAGSRQWVTAGRAE